MRHWLAGAGLLFAIGLAIMATARIVTLGTLDVPVAHGIQPMRSEFANDPEAILGSAREQLKAGQFPRASASALDLLRREPLQGGAIALLAYVADATQAGNARSLFELAMRRSPRDQHVRAWLIGAQLQNGEFVPAMANIDRLLRMAPRRSEVFDPVMASYSDEPGFVSALVDTLHDKPPWRRGFLDFLLRNGTQRSMDVIHEGLQDRGDLSAVETHAWLDRLMQDGHWGDAYSRWVSSLRLPPGSPVPLVANGGFEQSVTGMGFDWRLPGSPGVLVERVPMRGGRVLQLEFLGRRVPDPGVSQPLFLGPGAYRLHFLANAQSLRSDKGLGWSVRCKGSAAMRTNGPLLQGSFEWRTMSMDFTVPAFGCPVQELSLVNPGADGSGKIVSGQLWFDDIEIVPQPTEQ